MFKSLILVSGIFLIGCAGQPAKPYYPADMKNFVANCQQAKSQIDFLQREIDDYLEYHRTVPVTLEDQRYFGKLKNNIWSLRSSCSQKFL